MVRIGEYLCEAYANNKQNILKYFKHVTDMGFHLVLYVLIKNDAVTMNYTSLFEDSLTEAFPCVPVHVEYSTTKTEVNTFTYTYMFISNDLN